ncbi:hypothetical protein [Sphingomonas sp. LaA6.9]|uniref:hypothetical protein n=1 Tax=Sphingomonas sp. LaA6.9 TaxID=2919914 RepID=UPI001F4F9F28|nr:hypothetical protein [Sphingomonas sp. LaA6.9]MCJ8159355.1 hypothetical protein [Sphingomonas sp. LaA6.9]
MERIAIIDFEASCLPEAGYSYPIEVALSRVGGRTRSWLIKPARQWFYWDWCDHAESLHGISRDMLQEHGTTADAVLAELVAEADGCTVYADSDLDAHWLETLSQACGRSSPFPILFVGELFRDMQICCEAVSRADLEARQRLPMRHVACKDARRLAMTVKLLATPPRA